MMSTTDDECRSDAFVRSFVRSFFVFVRFRSSAHSDGVPARAVRVRTRHRAIATRHRDLPSVVVTYVFKPHEPDLQLHVSPEPPKKPCTDTPEGNVASIDGPLRRVMTRPIDRPPDRSRPRLDAPTRLDDARRPWRCETRRTTPPSGANPRDRRRNCASYRAGASRPIDRSTGRPIARASSLAARHSNGDHGD